MAVPNRPDTVWIIIPVLFHRDHMDQGPLERQFYAEMARQGLELEGVGMAERFV